ncbi:MAG TPA: hypothetical protein VLW52_00895 [Opitutaceae bacterium]|nr:hypothetical protein [Opitutaceae bacterium]
MKTAFPRGFGWMASALAATAALLLMAGCLEKHLVWSPDGRQAVVIAKDGLHLCDPDGRLTPLLMPDVDQAAWLGDSERLVVVRERRVGDWSTIARFAGAERAAALAAQAESIWRQFEAGGKWGVLTMEQGKDKTAAFLKIFLRERHGEALRAKLSAGDWDDLSGKQVDLSQLIPARIAGGQITAGAVLHEGLEKIENLRLAPGDQMIAYTTDDALGSDDDCRLLLARIDDTEVALVAEHTNLSPDWTPDGRALVYVQAAGTPSQKDDLRLATLVRREVIDEGGRIKVAEKPEELAGLMFSNTTRVRCLRDGLVLFNTVEFSLPITTKDADVEREKLFMWDAARQSTLVRVIPRLEQEKLPKNLTFFEVSPDEKRLLVGGVDGEVSVLTLATGEVEELQKAGDYNLMAAPVWRNADEVTFARRNPAVDGRNPERKVEIVRRKVVMQKGDAETVLSRDWSREMLESVFSPGDKK